MGLFARKKASGRKAHVETPERPKRPGGKGIALTDEQLAAIWVHYAETGSVRKTAAALGVGSATVVRTLHSDPKAYREIVAAREDERAERWKRIEELALTEGEQLIAGCAKYRVEVEAMPAYRYGAPDRFNDFTKALGTIVRVAEQAAGKAQLLSGGATERVDRASTSAPGELSDEQIVELAEELGLPIPPGVRDRQRRGAAG